MNFEHEIVEAAIDTNYRRLIDGRSIDIHRYLLTWGIIHKIIFYNDIDKKFQEPLSVNDLSGIAAYGTGVNQQKRHKGELRNIIASRREF